MFSKIMVPVDIRHLDEQARALAVATDLGRNYGAELCFVTVSSPLPGVLGHSPDEVRAALNEFAQGQADSHAVKASAHLALCNDPSIDLDKSLLAAVDDTGADLVVMASHIPGWADFLTGSHGGALATDAPISVMVVRGE